MGVSLFRGLWFPLLLANTATAANVWVGPNGSDTITTSSQAAPFKTLAKAALVVNAGDVVNIAAGSYAPFTLTRSGVAPTAPNLVGGAGGNPITWKPITAGTVEVVGDSSGGPAIRVQASYQIIDGLIIRGNTEGVTLAQAQAYYAANPLGVAYNGVGVLLDNTGSSTPVHGLWLRNNVIRNFGCNGVDIIGSDYNAVDRNQIYDNAWYSSRNCSALSLAVAPRAADPVSTDNLYHSVIIGNKIWNNRVQVANATLVRAGGNGIVVTATDPAIKGRTIVFTNVITNNGGSAIVLADARRADVTFNSTYMNGASAGAAELTVTGTTDFNVKTNIFSASTGGKVYTTANNTVVDPALFKVPPINYNITFNGTPLGDADIAVDPQFNNPQLDPRLADFKLKSTSPAIDTAFGGSAGNTRVRADLPNLPTNGTWGYDGDGVVYRTFNGNGLDRGAYEYTYVTLALGWGDNNRKAVAVGVAAASDASGETNGSWTFVGRGSGLRTGADSMSIAAKAWTGDVVVTAKLVSATVRDEPEAVVGLTIRAGTSAALPLINAAHVSTLVSPTTGPLYARRLTVGGPTRRTAGDVTQSQNVWLRIARVGSNVTSSASTDGVNWTVIRREVVTLPANVQVGVVYSNGRPGTNVAANWVTVTDLTVTAP